MSFIQLTIYVNFAQMYHIKNFLEKIIKNKCLPLPDFFNYITGITAVLLGLRMGFKFFQIYFSKSVIYMNAYSNIIIKITILNIFIIISFEVVLVNVILLLCSFNVISIYTGYHTRATGKI